MEKSSSDKVIKSLVHVTRHADREILEISLATTLYELLNVDRVLLYKIFHNAKQIECYCSILVEDGETKFLDAGVSTDLIEIDSVPGFNECIHTQETVSTRIGGKNTIILYPIIDQLNHVFSIFRIDRSGQKRNFNDEFIAGYFQIYKNYLSLLDESERDTLTNLLNRRTFDRDLKKILTEKNNSPEPLENVDDSSDKRNVQDNSTHWLAVSDIDFFKRVNDDFGHLYGDEVLLLMANIMRETFRGTDMLFRFGGEEFVTILRSTNQQGAHQALERFRRTVEEYDFPQVGNVTISIGYIEITKDVVATEILGHADEALYYSKDNGRNQLNQYEKLRDDKKIANTSTVIDDVELF